MQSDTVIGIVGAVVLVSVMVGVFAYEYNNVPEAEGEPTAAEIVASQKMMFNESFPELMADGDLDDDGIPNWNETDLDNDGINNTEDDVFDYKRDIPFTGAVGQGANTPFSTGASWQSSAFDAEGGVRHIMLTMTHAARVTGQVVAPLDVVLSFPDGSRTATVTVDGDVMTYTIEIMDDIALGEYQITVGAYDAGTVPVGGDLGTTFNGTLSFHYMA